jgi:hypothetical protein
MRALLQSERVRQWLWFVGLWAAGVATLTVVAFALRIVMKAAGAS